MKSQLCWGNDKQCRYFSVIIQFLSIALTDSSRIRLELDTHGSNIIDLKPYDYNMFDNFMTKVPFLRIPVCLCLGHLFIQTQKVRGWCSSIWLVGWLIFVGLTALWNSISVYIVPSLWRRTKEKKSGRQRKMSKQPLPSPTASTVSPCPTIIQSSRTPQHWKFPTTIPVQTRMNYDDARGDGLRPPHGTTSEELNKLAASILM